MQLLLFVIVIIGAFFYGMWEAGRPPALPPRPRYVVEIVAEQFHWEVRYPGPDGELHTADDVFAINEVVIPESEAGCLVRVTSKDVRHCLYSVPPRSGRPRRAPGAFQKFDVEPGEWREWYVTEWDREFFCTDYCGQGHYAMRGRIVRFSDAFFAKAMEAYAANQKREGKNEWVGCDGTKRYEFTMESGVRVGERIYYDPQGREVHAEGRW